jgi:DNA invertase Pin-like site-specific DNA recombinase
MLWPTAGDEVTRVVLNYGVGNSGSSLRVLASAANVGADKDSEKRQRAAVEGCASRGGFRVVDEFYDEAVSGKDPIEGRPGFKALLERIVENGIRTVIVEDGSRFAPHLMTQEAGIALLVGFGVRVSEPAYNTTNS